MRRFWKKSLLLGALLVFALSGLAVAEDYPTRPIEVIVGWGAGGGTDTFARAITKPASEILGKPMPVKNMQGASGAIAGDYVTQQPADGYTLWAMGSNYAVNLALGRTPHILDEYIPIARIQQDTAMIQVQGNSRFKTIDDLIAYAKENPNKLKLAGAGAASFDQVVVSLWENAAGIKVNYIPYENSGSMHSALLGGHVDAMFEEMGPVAGLVENGQLRPLLVFSETKIPSMPQVATAVEKGWNITLGNWRGIVVAKGTPQPIVDKLRAAFAKAKDDPGYKKFEADRYLNLRPGFMDSEQFRQSIEENASAYKKALKMAGQI